MKGKQRSAVPGKATKSPVTTCPDCEHNQAEVGLIAHELGFWKCMAIGHRAWCLAGFKEPDEIDMKRAEAELERVRQLENRECYAHAEPARETGS